jgi:regulator of sigma E protease
MTPPDQPGDPPAGTPAPNSISDWLSQNAFTLAVVALLVGLMYWYGVDFLNVGKVAVGLGLVIFIHELGHFLAAKWCDVHVETFSIGFGPPLPGCEFRYGETSYKLALFPLGGYVKMVGEGADEEADDDPRSFKNKTVGQRMLIISAGVAMNVLLAAVCFVGVYMTSGVDRTAGVIGTVEAGSPAWQQGLHAGVLLYKIGDSDNPYFDDVMPEVMHWPAGQPIPVVYESFGGRQPKEYRTQVTPRKNEATGRPMIGIAPAHTTVLRPPTRFYRPPYQANSAAARAEPPFLNGDRIVGTTDPDQPLDAGYRAGRTLPLPLDPRNPGSGRYDYFELARRFRKLDDKEIVVQVRRAGQPEESKPVEVRVPPAYHTDFGLRMAMGQVVAVRTDSPAARAGVQPRDTPTHPVGDVLVGVEVQQDDGTVVRYVSVPAKKGERPLDPMRLPYELDQWAAQRRNGPKEVTLTLMRQIGHKEDGRVTLTMTWDDAWRDEMSASSSPNSPVGIDGLGLAYAVTTLIADVKAGSPADLAGLKKDDVIKAVQLYHSSNSGKSEPLKWLDLEREQCAFTYWGLAQEEMDGRKLGLRVVRGDQPAFDVVLDGVEDSHWPMAVRGLALEYDTRLQKAGTFVDALAMGTRRTGRLISQIYQNLLAMVDGRISFKKNASGPLSIAAVSYDIAGESLSLFILFLGMISVNLAVINFLPIPVLDGGHMMFLVYEWVRGRPAPEQVRFAATFVGLALIGSLMLFVIYLDVKRLWF